MKALTARIQYGTRRAGEVLRQLWYAALISPAIGFAQTSVAAAAFQRILCQVFYWVYTFALVAGIIFVVMAGIKYMSSSGDSGKVGEAHRSLLYGTIGIVVAFFSGSMPSIIGSTLQLGSATPCP